MSMNAYEFVELLSREIPRDNVTSLTLGREPNRKVQNFIPLMVAGGLFFIAILIFVGFKISKSLEKSPATDEPPSYLDVVVPAPSSAQILENFERPPTYSEVVKDPPPYSFENAAFACDPPEYSEIQESVEIVIETQSTTVFT